MKINTSALALGLIASPMLALSSAVPESPSRMQRLTRRVAIDLSSSSSPFARRNATTFVPRQDKVDSTVSNSTTSTSASTIGDLVNEHVRDDAGAGSPYNVAGALQMLHEGVVVTPKHGLVRRGEEGDKMAITYNDDDDGEECEEEEDEDDDEQCEEDGEEDEEECQEDDDAEDEDCEEEDGDSQVSPIGGEVSFGTVLTPNNLAEGSLKAEEGCTKFTTVVSGDTCYKLIGAKDDDLLKTFYKNNPAVDSGCKNLKIGVAYCVSSAAVAEKEQPKQEEAKKEELQQGEPKQEEIKQEEPKKEEPKQQESKKEAPKLEEVKVTPPKQAEKSADEPKNEEPPKKEEPKQVSGKKADATYYYQKGNAGHCGWKKSDNDYIVALHPSLYGKGERCGKNVRITNPITGKTVTAMVADSCPSCAPASDSKAAQIDLSDGLFKALSNGADGLFQVTYEFE